MNKEKKVSTKITDGAANFLRDSAIKWNNKYDYSLVEYTGSKTGTANHVRIICHEHREIFKQNPSNHKSSKFVPCTRCKQDPLKKKNTALRAYNRAEYLKEFPNSTSGVQPFINECISIKAFYQGDLFKYNYDKFEYEGENEEGIVQCITHNMTFKITPKEHLQGITHCKECVKENEHKSRDAFKVDLFIAQAIKVHNDAYLYDEYEYADNPHASILITCKKCNGTFDMSIYEHIIRGYGCPCLRIEDTTGLIDGCLVYNKVFQYVDTKNGKVEGLHENSVVADVCLFTCKYGNSWESTIANVIYHQTWCPCERCIFRSKYEMITREILQLLFKKEFKTTNKLLPNNLQLDGYNQELNLAFEYQGRQHYRIQDQFSRCSDTRTDLYNQILERDARKKVECKQRDIRLIIIPLTCRTIESILDEVMMQLKAFNMVELIVGKVNCVNVQNALHVADHNAVGMEKVKLIAINRGVECLSDKYVNGKTKHEFKCGKCNKVFTKTYDEMTRTDKHGGMCIRCNGREKLTDEIVSERVQAVGGTFIRWYKNDDDPAVVVFTCKNGHNVSITVDNLKRTIRAKTKTGGCQACRTKA
jgi:hypothetical protein